MVDSAHMSRESGSARRQEGGPLPGKGLALQLCVHFLVGMGRGPAGSCGVDTAGKLPRASLKTTHSREGHPANHVVKDTAFHVSALWVVTIAHDIVWLRRDHVHVINYIL